MHEIQLTVSRADGSISVYSEGDLYIRDPYTYSQENLIYGIYGAGSYEVSVLEGYVDVGRQKVAYMPFLIATRREISTDSYKGHDLAIANFKNTTFESNAVIGKVLAKMDMTVSNGSIIKVCDELSYDIKRIITPVLENAGFTFE